MSFYGYSNDQVEALNLNTLQVPFHSIKFFIGKTISILLYDPQGMAASRYQFQEYIRSCPHKQFCVFSTYQHVCGVFQNVNLCFSMSNFILLMLIDGIDQSSPGTEFARDVI